MECLVFICVLVLTIKFGHSCSPCSCSTIAEGKWKTELFCDSVLNLTTIPDISDKNFEVLTIRDQKLTELKENSFIQFQNLRVIDLGNNLISNINKNAFKSMTKVEEINLENNTIHTIPNSLFSETESLEIIRLNNNELTFLPRYLFSNLKFLKDVYLSNNKISVIEEHCFYKVPQLFKLKLNENNLTSLELNIIDNPHSLKRVFLEKNLWDCENLCALMDTALASNWIDSRYMPTCYSPDKLKNKTWTNLVSDFKPSTSQYQKISSEEGKDVSLTCSYCFASRLIWTFSSTQDQIFDNDQYEIIHRPENLESVLIIKNFDNEEHDSNSYSCKIRGCNDCGDDHNLNFEVYLIGKNIRLLRHCGILFSIILLGVLAYKGKLRYKRYLAEKNGTSNVDVDEPVDKDLDERNDSEENKITKDDDRENNETSKTETEIKSELCNETGESEENVNNINKEEKESLAEIVEIRETNEKNANLDTISLASKASSKKEYDEVQYIKHNEKATEIDATELEKIGETSSLTEKNLEPHVQISKEEIIIHEPNTYLMILDFATTVAFFGLYLADFYATIALAVYYYFRQDYYYDIYFYVTASCIILTALLSAIFERSTHVKKGVLHYLAFFPIFILNLSGFLLYKEVLILKCKKIIHTLKGEPIKPRNNLQLRKNFRDLVFFGTVQAYFKNLPLIILQLYVFDTSKALLNLNFTETEWNSFVISYLMIIISTIELVNSESLITDRISIWLHLLKYFWIILITVAKVNTILITTVTKAKQFLVFVLLHSLLFGRYSFNNINVNKDSGKDPTATYKESFLASTVYSFIYMLAPYIHVGSTNFCETEGIYFVHVIHFSDIFILSIYFTRYYTAYYLSTIGIYIVGVFVFLGFIKLKQGKINFTCAPIPSDEL